MNFINKMTLLFVLFISSSFFAYSMSKHEQDAQKRTLEIVTEFISTTPDTTPNATVFHALLDRLQVETIRNYRTDAENSLLHLSTIYGKPIFVEILLAGNFFNLYEENKAHFNPIQLAIRNIEAQSNSRKSDLDIIKNNLTIIEMLSAKDVSFKDYFSYVLFLLVKCLARSGSAELHDIITVFYRNNSGYISVDDFFEKTTAFDLVIDNDAPYILLIFLKTHDINAGVLNKRLEDLLIIASQYSDSSLLDKILEQSNLDKQLLCDLMHDYELRGMSDEIKSAISNEIRTRVLSFIKRDSPHLLTTPGAVIASDGAPGLRLRRKTKSIDPKVLDKLAKLDLSKLD